jgi:hypothetical protein
VIEGKISSYSLESEISGDSSLEGKVSSGHYIEGEVASEHFVEGEVASGHSVEGEIASERSITGKVAGSQRMAAAIAPKALDGISPEIEITEVEGGHKLVVTDKKGKKEAVVLDGEDGRGIELFWQSKVTTIPGDTNEWTIRYTDGTESVIAIKNSEDGKPGAPGHTPIKGVDYDDGAPGFSPVVSLRKEGEVTLLAITDIKGTQEVRINDGEPGTPGSAGVGIANVTQIVKSGTDGGTNVVTIALTDGTEHSFEVQNGTKGRAITVIDVDETLADDEHNRVLFSDGSVLKVKNGRTGSPGKDGKSITITDIYESNANGGKNIVLFSDGTTLHIKNGEIGLRDRPDWSENDTSALAYIRNRTHWIEQALEVITEDMGIGSSEIIESFNTGFESPLVLKVVVGNKYAINTDPSVYYYCTAYDYTDSNGDTFIALGDSRLDGVASETHPEDVPVFIKYSVKEETPSGGGVRYRHQFRYFYSDSTANNAKLSALGSDVVYHPLDEKFIPDTIARVSQLGEVGTTITGFVENTEPGGSSIVTFSDGSTLTIKNGTNGNPGEAGLGIAMVWQSAYDPNPGGTNSWTIQYTDGTQSVISVKNGENGTNGTSVYVSSIKESTEDGGENVVTFAGAVPKTLTVRNGSKGSAGKSAYQYAKDGGFAGTETEFITKLATAYLALAGGNISGHIYLTGAKATSSTSNTSQIVFGTSESNHIAVSSNTHAIILNPSTTSTSNQIELQLDKKSVFPNGISANITGNLTGTASKATADANGNNIADTYLPRAGGTMLGALELADDPTTNKQAVTKQYVDNISIGGRNLIKNTKTFEGWTKATNITAQDGIITWAAVSSLGWNAITNRDAALNYSEVRNKEVTISFEVRCDEYDALNSQSGNGLIMNFALHRQGTGSRYRWADVLYFDYAMSGQWERIEHTFTVSDSFFISGEGDTIPDTDTFVIGFYNYALQSIQIRNVKLERGNKATDWTLAPEDEIYLPLTGGNLTGVIDASGTVNILDFGTTGWFRGKTTAGGRYDIFGYSNPTTLQVGGSYPALALKGKNTRPTYNNSDMALLSDVGVTNAPVNVTSSDGVAYAATVSSITATSLTDLKGVRITIIPNMTSTSASSVTLNINNLGAKAVKRWDNLNTSEWWSFTAADWLKAGYPLTVTFNGSYWMIEGMNKPYASDLQGTVAVAKGGTGVTSHADTTYTTARYRASALVSSETNPTVNGVVNWIYE